MRRVALSAVAVAMLAAALLVALSWGSPASLLMAVTFGGVGAYVAIRRPRSTIGWLLIVIGWGAMLGTMPEPVPGTGTGRDGWSDGAAAIAAWGGAWGFPLAFIAWFALVVVFPEGRLPRGRRGAAFGVGLVVLAILGALIAFGPTIALTTTIESEWPNPFAIAPASALWELAPSTNDRYLAMFIIVAVGSATLLARARRATGIARLQYRWFVSAIVLTVTTTSVWAFTTVGLGMDPVGPTWWLAMLTFPAIPIAVAVAVLRYRLFEIDRIISRSLSWALITGVLIVTFGALVIGLGAALTDVGGGDTLAVAVSTLVAFALFQPVRRTIQRAVDRHFDRSRYDAQRTTDDFAARLRDEVDLATVTADLAGTTRAGLAPASLAIWLREERS